jgi:mannose-1-phosphate guanylyltransferase/mannose-6-phosphate isomerase
MAIFPVILCGGAGTRLWPASRPERPKQFLDLTSELSLFQETVERVAPLADGGGKVVVVAGRGHRAFVEDQLGGVPAVVLLEPEGRDSAAAMTAASQWVVSQDPEGVAVFVASDHHIPDDAAFRFSVLEAVAAAGSGRIVVFGVEPSEPSSAYGYIKPEHSGLAPVTSFVEKPDRETAAVYLQQGYLWNSGNLVTKARVLLDEVQAFAPDVARAVASAMPSGLDGVLELGPGFQASPRISMDFAVLERSHLVWVLPVGFGWSDLGAWDAVAATESGGKGLWIGDSGDGANLVRAAEGMVVATAGVSDLAIIAERDAVLVCHLSRSQEVKGLVERLRLMSPGHMGAPAEPDTLSTISIRFLKWLDLAALPLWATLGVGADGVFVEALDPQGRLVGHFQRARVQARQAYVYSAAGRAGWPGRWSALCLDALSMFEVRHLRPDGLYRTRVHADGSVLDDTPWVYDQAFALFAFAGASASGLEPEMFSSRAHRTLEALDGLRHAAGGWREAGEHRFQANAHMHLLEACLAWETLEPDGPWTACADEIVELAGRRFFDREGGYLREFFDASWNPAAGTAGRLVEPGHQFEWAWLLSQWAERRGQVWASQTAGRLYEAGCRGLDSRTGITLDALNTDFSIRSRQARLWPQTERLKAALIMADLAGEADRVRYLRDAHSALKGLMRYLDPAGLWQDKLQADGRFIAEAAPASSLYHIMSAAEQLRAVMPKFERWGI